MERRFKILRCVEVDQEEFLRFWSKKYAYPLEGLYNKNIKKPLNSKKIEKLFRWKNDGPLSPLKKMSVEEHYIPQLKKLSIPKNMSEAKKYLKKLGGGPIWGIFWLHCLSPQKFPIFDQHTYRAMADILGMAETEIPMLAKKKLEIYFDKYMPFIKSFNEPNIRYVDKALFSYGRALKSNLLDV